MGLGPRGDGRAGPPRRAGPMMTAIVFGSLIFGGWRRAPPSAAAGPPRLWRRPTALRGDVCGDARACAAGGTRSRRCLPHRSAKPPGLVSAARPACVVSFLAMAGELSGEASALLRRLGLDERVGPVFAREQIDENALPFLTVEDLVEAGVATDDARKIVSTVEFEARRAAGTALVAVPDAEPAAEPADTAAEEPAPAAEDTPAPESKQIPERLCCPISLELMVRPVIAADGHTYDRSSIEDWLARGNTTSPTTGAKLEHLHLADNHLVRSMVSEYQDSLASR